MEGCHRHLTEAPHIVLMAFLHRILKGGGTLEREYAIDINHLRLFVVNRELYPNTVQLRIIVKKIIL